jgi:hypothetical protein
MGITGGTRMDSWTLGIPMDSMFQKRYQRLEAQIKSRVSIQSLTSNYGIAIIQKSIQYSDYWRQFKYVSVERKEVGEDLQEQRR